MKWRITNFETDYEEVEGRFDVNLWVPTERGIEINATDPRCWAHLFITLKIYYEKDDRGSRAVLKNSNYETRAWPEDHWKYFINTVNSLSRFWDLRFWLVLKEGKQKTSAYKDIERYLAIYEDTYPVNGRKQRVVFPRVIACRFYLDILPADTGAHKKIKVAYIVDKTTGLPTTDIIANRSDAEYYDSADIFSLSNGFNTIVHEIGHAIGLPHIGIVTEFDGCSTMVNRRRNYVDKTPEGKANAAMCYQGPYATDIMGDGGNDVHWQDALPWRLALQKMTGVPLDDYWVQMIPFRPPYRTEEVVEEGTQRWYDFF